MAAGLSTPRETFQSPAFIRIFLLIVLLYFILLSSSGCIYHGASKSQLEQHEDLIPQTESEVIKNISIEKIDLPGYEEAVAISKGYSILSSTSKSHTSSVPTTLSKARILSTITTTSTTTSTSTTTTTPHVQTELQTSEYTTTSCGPKKTTTTFTPIVTVTIPRSSSVTQTSEPTTIPNDELAKQIDEAAQKMKQEEYDEQIQKELKDTKERLRMEKSEISRIESAIRNAGIKDDAELQAQGISREDESKGSEELKKRNEIKDRDMIEKLADEMGGSERKRNEQKKKFDGDGCVRDWSVSWYRCL